MKVCKDCYPKGPDPWVKVSNLRPAPHPGPRCATHHRAKRMMDKKRAWANRLKKVYDITEDQYNDMLECQNGVCFICQRANGRTKRLAVDHDHKTGLIRGILCGPCNDILGHARDDEKFFRRAASYLSLPPAMQLGIYAVHEENRD